MARYYGKLNKYQELQEWYDGYRFGNTEIYNPWSVIGYFSNNCKARTYWQFTGSNDIIREVLAAATPEVTERLELLMKGHSFVTHVDTSVIYPQIQKDPSSIYSFLLVAGYLKVGWHETGYLILKVDSLPPGKKAVFTINEIHLERTAVNQLRNKKIQHGQYTDATDDMLLKLI